MYNELSRAIWVADNVAARIREVSGADADRRAELAEVRIWGGFAQLMLANNYCEGSIAAVATAIASVK